MSADTRINASDCRIFVIDDDASVCRGISRLLLSAGYETEIYHSAVDYLQRESYDGIGCILLDVRMPGLSGIELQKLLNQRGIDLPVIFLTGHGDLPMGIKAMKRGAVDFLSKPVDEELLLDSVSSALANHRAVHSKRLEKSALQVRLESLTPRQFEVLQCILGGAVNREIASELAITEKTVKAHRAQVMIKMGASSPAVLGRLCASLGMTSK